MQVPYGIVKIGLQKLKHQIQVFVVLGPDYLVQFDDIRVVKLVQQYYLPICALSVRGVLKSIEYFF